MAGRGGDAGFNTATGWWWRRRWFLRWRRAASSSLVSDDAGDLVRVFSSAGADLAVGEGDFEAEGGCGVVQRIGGVGFDGEYVVSVGGGGRVNNFGWLFIHGKTLV